MSPNSSSSSPEWILGYLSPYRDLILSEDALLALPQFTEMLKAARERNGKVILAGNGASAAIASHLANDFTKQGGVRSVTFHDPAFITAFSNDYGYDLWLAKALEHHLNPEDLVVLISSSGKSPNIVKAAEYARSREVPVAAFTGFDRDNPLNKIADICFWADSRAYNHIECVHMIWLTAAVDILIGKAEYRVS